MAFFLSPERLDAAVGRGPLLLVGGLALAVAASTWGGAGCVLAGFVAWTGVSRLLFLDWRMNLAARLTSAVMLILAVAMAALVLSRASQEGRLSRLADLAGAGVALVAHARFLVSVLRGQGRYTPGDVPALDLHITRGPSRPGHEGLTQRDGLQEPDGLARGGRQTGRGGGDHFRGGP